MPETGRAARSAARGFGATILDALEALAVKGYRGSFRVVGPQTLQCLACRATHDPIELAMEELVRVEGVSDPADEEAIVGLTCPACSTRGTLVLTYGTNATPEDGEALVRLRDERARSA